MTTVGMLTWAEAADRLSAGALAILPVGAGAKQHGFHLPMATDRLQAEWIAARLAETFDALVWPTLAYGHYPAFVDYAGSVSLSSDLFEALVHEVVGGLVGYGARVIVVDTGISTHAPINRVVTRLGDPSRCLHLRVYDGPRTRAGRTDLAIQTHGGHADEFETAIMLALAPEAVTMDRAVLGTIRPPGPGPMQHRDPSAANYSRSGAIGDPTCATRAKGEAFLAWMMEDAREAVAQWRTAGGC